jgi:hypothetical protein
MNQTITPPIYRVRFTLVELQIGQGGGWIMGVPSRLAQVRAAEHGGAQESAFTFAQNGMGLQRVLYCVSPLPRAERRVMTDDPFLLTTPQPARKPRPGEPLWELWTDDIVGLRAPVSRRVWRRGADLQKWRFLDRATVRSARARSAMGGGRAEGSRKSMTGRAERRCTTRTSC